MDTMTTPRRRPPRRTDNPAAGPRTHMLGYTVTEVCAETIVAIAEVQGIHRVSVVEEAVRWYARHLGILPPVEPRPDLDV